MTQDSGADFKDNLKELDRDQTRILIRSETRRFKKPTTLIIGLPKEKKELARIARELKRELATGGSAKESVIILQGDHRVTAKRALIKLGFHDSEIEVQ